MKINLSLEKKLFSTLIGICTLSILGFLVLGRMNRRVIEQAKQAKTQALAESLMDKIDRNLFERYENVQAFAMSDSARSGNPARIAEFMNEMMKVYAPSYDLMMVTDIHGRVIAVNGVDKFGKFLKSESLLNKDYSNQEWFKAALGGKIKEGTAWVEAPHADVDVAHICEHCGPGMNFTAPIRDKATGTIVGVWTNRMSWTDVVESITRESLNKAKNEHFEGALGSLLDAHGTVLLPSEGNEFELSKTKNSVDAALRIKASAPSVGYAAYPGNGWTAVVQVPATDSQLSLNNRLVLAAIVILLFVVALASMMVKRISVTFRGAISRLRTDAGQVNSTANQITGASKNLAEASTKQASALQETASAIEQLNAMVKKSSESANRSREVAGDSQKAASRGKETVDEMVVAIEEINRSNNDILLQVEDGNRQITEIVKVITEIGNKTKVINDIVFQTKLLSFNASVEAARAGEHGKGFAVVAEEVGNLAQMSGNAAKEISEMLGESIQKVEGIVADTKTKVDRLIAAGRSRVDSGASIAKNCGEVLEEIVKNVSEVNTMVDEISTAAHEQAIGITEITKAMNQLDHVTHQNAATSQQAAASASELVRQADSLMGVVSTLRVVVEGGGNVTKKIPVKKVINTAPLKKPIVPPVVVTKEKETTGKVLQFKESHKENMPVKKAIAVKKVAIGGNELPAENDPRFEDV